MITAKQTIPSLFVVEQYRLISSHKTSIEFKLRELIMGRKACAQPLDLAV